MLSDIEEQGEHSNSGARPHADVIKAWADGAVVEFHNPQTFDPGRWVLCDFPTWRADCLYRVREAAK